MEAGWQWQERGQGVHARSSLELDLWAHGLAHGWLGAAKLLEVVVQAFNLLDHGPVAAALFFLDFSKIGQYIRLDALGLRRDTEYAQNA